MRISSQPSAHGRAEPKAEKKREEGRIHRHSFSWTAAIAEKSIAAGILIARATKLSSPDTHWMSEVNCFIKIRCLDWRWDALVFVVCEQDEWSTFKGKTKLFNTQDRRCYSSIEREPTVSKRNSTLFGSSSGEEQRPLRCLRHRRTRLGVQPIDEMPNV